MGGNAKSTVFVGFAASVTALPRNAYGEAVTPLSPLCAFPGNAVTLRFEPMNIGVLALLPRFSGKGNAVTQRN